MKSFQYSYRYCSSSHNAEPNHTEVSAYSTEILGYLLSLVPTASLPYTIAELERHTPSYPYKANELNIFAATTSTEVIMAADSGAAEHIEAIVEFLSGAEKASRRMPT